MSLRIIAGDLRGRRLKSHERPGLRPTTDRVRESVFSMLGSRLDFEGIEVLDLFAGTGALGIEAISRGAARCTFVEGDRRTARLIEENLRELGIAERASVVAGDAVKFVSTVEASYDLIVADPPYAATVFDRLVQEVFTRGLLRGSGLFLLEHSSAMRPRSAPGAAIVATRGFGDTDVTIFGVDRDAGATEPR
ncbi:MAG TPA: 16S rRNA (guanine(966)-N(2))-methyltransferase RsmD [Candidatus Kapabacteria bacterium]|jgi:16S rRNA (guanine966-N2)-methyltransferase|nr:16S rRNA (guanine(966)-N(2))-methyltransferase RsmD [Candidatus Kapabacteria bacterium]